MSFGGSIGGSSLCYTAGDTSLDTGVFSRLDMGPFVSILGFKP